MFGFNPQKQLQSEHEYNAFFFITDEHATCGRETIKIKPQKYLLMEIMFIQQDYQWPAVEKKKPLMLY